PGIVRAGTAQPPLRCHRPVHGRRSRAGREARPGGAGHPPGDGPPRPLPDRRGDRRGRPRGVGRLQMRAVRSEASVVDRIGGIPVMAQGTALSEAEVRQLVVDWYRKLDVHAPVDEYRQLLADDGLEMRFPEATLHGFSAFRDWYERVVRIFFDE